MHVGGWVGRLGGGRVEMWDNGRLGWNETAGRIGVGRLLRER